MSIPKHAGRLRRFEWTSECEGAAVVFDARCQQVTEHEREPNPSATLEHDHGLAQALANARDEAARRELGCGLSVKATAAHGP